MSLLERFEVLLPVGFYYKMPPWAWRWAEPVIRRMAGLGKIASDAPVEHSEHVYLHCDIAVVGGGPAGCSAAIAAAEAGAEVFLIDDQEELGGSLRYYRRVPSSESRSTGFEMARRLAEQVSAQSRIRVFPRATAFGAYEGGLLAVRQGPSLIHLRAARRVIATGSFEHPPSFDGNDLPGVMLALGVRRLIELYGVSPGNEAVIYGGDDDALALALDLRESGIRVAAVADSRDGVSNRWTAALAHASVPYLPGYRIVAASGSKRVKSAALASATGPVRRTPCDLIVLATGHAPSLELLRQSGVKCVYDETLHQMVPVEPVPDVLWAGRLTRHSRAGN